MERNQRTNNIDRKPGGFKKDHRSFNNDKKYSDRPFKKFNDQKNDHSFKNHKDHFSKDHQESKFDRYHNDDRRKDNYKKKAVNEDIKEENERIFYTDNEDLVYDERVKVRLECIGLSHDARGIAKVNGITRKGQVLTNYPIFVPNFIPGEKANVEITTLKKTYGEGKLLDVKFYSPLNRAVPICPNYHSCGGCDLMHMTYPCQLNFKENLVRESLEHLGGITGVEVDPIIGMEDPYHYRNKVQVPYHYFKNKTICGFYKKNTHEIVSLDTCFIQSELASDLVKFIRNICNELKIRGYLEESHEGILRHVMIRENKDQSEVMVVLVTKVKEVPNLDILVNKIINRYKMVTSIIQNINPDKCNVVLGKENILLHGKMSIKDELLGTYFNIGPMSFYQVNTKQTEKLYSKVIEKANLNKNDVLIDAYCGIGTIGLIASKYVKKVYGVEIVPEAIENAEINKELNNIKNAEFVCNKAEDQIVKWSKSRMKPTVIVVDPPRKGCDEVLLKTVMDMAIPKMIYVSCNPATLSRDLKILTETAYSITSISPVDMFPNSNHVETVVCMERK